MAENSVVVEVGVCAGFLPVLRVAAFFQSVAVVDAKAVGRKNSGEEEEREIQAPLKVRRDRRNSPQNWSCGCLLWSRELNNSPNFDIVLVLGQFPVHRLVVELCGG